MILAYGTEAYLKVKGSLCILAQLEIAGVMFEKKYIRGEMDFT